MQRCLYRSTEDAMKKRRKKQKIVKKQHTLQRFQTGRLLFGLLLCCLLAAGCGGSDQVAESHTCTISIDCSSILDNRDDLKAEKAEFVPSDGWILEPEEVSFKSGDTAFDVLKNACNQAGI